MNPDIPTALTALETQCLRALAHRKTVIEVGSLLGFSTIVMAVVAQQVIAIDPHVGYPVNDPRPTFNTFIENLARYDVRNVIPILARGQDVLPLLAGNIGLVFIDTMGDDEGTFELLFEAGKLAPEYIAVHDYGRNDSWDCTGVARAVRRFTALRCSGWSDEPAVADTLAVLRRK